MKILEQNSRTKKNPDEVLKIRDDLKRRLPFGNLKSRHAIAIVLSFVGTTLDVYPMMLKINHTTRAYIHNEKGLKGFLEPGSFTTFVMSKSIEGELDEVAGNVKVDV